jgi:hypothetical protein
MVAVVVKTLTDSEEPTVPSVVCATFAANGTYINISNYTKPPTSTKWLEILVTGIHRQIKSLRTSDEWSLGLQIFSKFFVIKFHSALRQVSLLIACGRERHWVIPLLSLGMRAGWSLSFQLVYVLGKRRVCQVPLIFVRGHPLDICISQFLDLACSTRVVARTGRNAIVQT